jgi:hypothetical protein
MAKIQHLSAAICDGLRASTTPITSTNPPASAADIGPHPVQYEIVAITNDTFKDSTNNVPTGKITRILVSVDTPYTTSGTIANLDVGYVGATTGLIDHTTDVIDMSVAGIHEFTDVKVWSNAKVRATLNNFADITAGAATLIVEYVV